MGVKKKNTPTAKPSKDEALELNWKPLQTQDLLIKHWLTVMLLALGENHSWVAMQYSSHDIKNERISNFNISNIRQLH